jgi:DnaJ-domain-containing protein 1
MPRIFVENSSGFGHFGDLKIVVDGKEKLKLSRNEKGDFTVRAGTHMLQARSGDLASDPVEFRAADRETLGFSCSVSGLLHRQLSVTALYHRRPIARFGAPVASKAEPPSPPTNSPKSEWSSLFHVSDSASMDEIRKAYLKLIWKYHPDRVMNLPDEQKAAAAHAARMINIAYAAAKKQRRNG